MQCYAIKTQHIEKEIAEYIKFDWEAFKNLTFDEKVTEYLKISEILLICRKFWSIHIQHANETEFTRKNENIKRIVQILEDLIILFAGMIEHMRANILFE